MKISNSLTVEWTSWHTSERAEVTTWEEALALVERAALQACPPFIMEFFSQISGQSLGLGIGRDLTVVTYQDSLDPPYFISLGNTESTGTEWFCYGNEESEYLTRNLIPVNQGLNALEFFVINRKKPIDLNWERL